MTPLAPSRASQAFHVFDDFAIYNGRCVLGVAHQLLRRAAQTTRQRLRPRHR